MYFLFLSTMGLMLTTWMLPKKKVWPTMISQTTLLFLSSSMTLSPMNKLKIINNLFSLDSLKSPLLMLSFWLLPVSFLASMAHLKNKPLLNSQTFMTLIIMILIALMMTFSASNLLLFFIGFESTLIPTLFLMTQWGMKEARMEAGYYFLFYTLMSSLPLLLGMMIMYNSQNHNKIFLFNYFYLYTNNAVLPMACLIAFLVKVPMFGFHLWLPKAHVEAPVAGSMILAAMLLKMGGYGLIRLTIMFQEHIFPSFSKFLIPFCCWGGALTSLMCLTQTDLKALMAYSSVSHMSFMVAAMASISSWGITGSLMVMMAHGIVSSGLFCMAKLFYERSGTRTLLMNRSLKKIFSITPLFWLALTCANLGLPPLPKSMGELIVFSSMITKSLPNFLPCLLGIIFTGIFSLTIYQLINSGTSFLWKKQMLPHSEREILNLFLHTLPLVMLMTNINQLTT